MSVLLTRKFDPPTDSLVDLSAAIEELRMHTGPDDATTVRVVVTPRGKVKSIRVESAR